MTIGIFDSGLGGEIVAEQLKRYFPDTRFRVVNDREHMPYGDRSQVEIYMLTERKIASLLGCDVIVIACNTATAAAIDQLRADFPEQPFVGYEPMVKPAAAMTKSGRVVILGTTATIASERFKKLVSIYGTDTHIITPDTTGWARDIELGKGSAIDLSEVARAIYDGADVIALACTHYIAIESRIRELSPTIQIIESTPAVAKQIATLVSQPR